MFANVGDRKTKYSLRRTDTMHENNDRLLAGGLVGHSEVSDLF